MSGGSSSGNLQVQQKVSAPPVLGENKDAQTFATLAKANTPEFRAQQAAQVYKSTNPKDVKSISNGLGTSFDSAAKKLRESGMTPDQLHDLYAKNGMLTGPVDYRANLRKYADWYVNNVPNASYTKDPSYRRASPLVATKGGSGQVIAPTGKLDLGGNTGGTKHLCGAMFSLGYLPEPIYAADLAYAQNVPAETKRGYDLWALPLAKVVRQNSLVAALCRPFVVAWANEMAGNSTTLGRALKRFGEPLCNWLGRKV
jgi:hypothetical protein